MPEYRVKYKKDRISLPCELLPLLAEATEEELKMLIYLAAKDEGIELEKPSFDKDAEKSALAFLRGAGLVVKENKKREKPEEKNEQGKQSDKASGAKKKKPLRPESILPEYTSREISDMLKKEEVMKSVIDSAQDIYGKMFSPAEINILLGLHGDLGFDGEFILLLISHAVEIGQKNMRYIEKMAFDLFEKGITTSSALEKEIERRDMFRSKEGGLRRLFGIGERALTAQEKKAFESWVNGYGFSLELITLAYEKTVAATGKASVNYCDKILTNWKEAGITTVEEAADGKKAKKPDKSAIKSFDTDDFFETALERSYKGK